jgi:hypothetical protein
MDVIRAAPRVSASRVKRTKKLKTRFMHILLDVNSFVGDNPPTVEKVSVSCALRRNALCDSIYGIEYIFDRLRQICKGDSGQALRRIHRHVLSIGVQKNKEGTRGSGERFDKLLNLRECDLCCVEEHNVRLGFRAKGLAIYGFSLDHLQARQGAQKFRNPQQ